MKAILAAVVLTMAAVGLDAWLLRSDGAADLLTPEPTRVVQAFIAALAANRPESARQYVVGGDQDAGATERLRRAADALRARVGRYRFDEAEARREGDTAEVAAHLRADRGAAMDRAFRLTRAPDTRLWKIAAFEL